MTRAARRRLGAGLALAAAAALLVGIAPAGQAASPTPTPGPTASPLGELAVHITGQAPLVPAPGETLRISGYVENTTSTTVTDVAVRLRLSPTPVRSRAEIDSILAGDAGRTGVAVNSTFTPLATALAPGLRTRFSLRVPLDGLNLSTDKAEVLVVGVESLADVPEDGVLVRQTGFTRTFLPWFPDPNLVDPTRVTMLFPLSTSPSRTGSGVFLDDHLGKEVAPAGRLSRLLDAAAEAPEAVAWVVDPALLESLRDMGDGYEVRAPDGALAAGEHAGDARAWLARLTSLVAGGRVTASAYALPDVVALHRAGLDLDIALATTTASDLPEEVLGVPVDQGLAWPIGALADDGTLDALRAAGARAVVLSAASFPPDPAVTYTPSGSIDLAAGGSPLRAVLADPEVSRLAASPRSTPDPALVDAVVRRQTAIATIAMTTLELPTTARSLIVAPDLWWRVDSTTTRDLVATLDSPWSTPQSLGALLATPASEVPRARADYPAAAQAAELTPGYLADVRAAREDLAALRSVAPDDGTTATTGLETALTRTESGAWRRDRLGGRELLETVTTTIDEQTSAVTVLSRAPVTLPGETGVIPVTVANDLDRPARVGLRLVGTPSVRFEADDVEPVTIAPGQKQTFEVTATVRGTGPVPVQISLLSPDGEVFGRPATTEVRSAAYARAAQGVVLGLFGILVLLLGANAVRRIRTSRAAQAGADDAGGAE
ncbi:MAG: DUF6049 family protein [Candidatus Nanopelagicales bacterium]